jgi:hypothetical protein
MTYFGLRTIRNETFELNERNFEAHRRIYTYLQTTLFLWKKLQTRLL